MPVGLKIVLMGAMCVVLMIGALAIWIMAYDRESTNSSVGREIASQWGGKVCVDGPVAYACADSAVLVAVVPSAMRTQASVETMSLHRGIYEAEVFTSRIVIAGEFPADAFVRHAHDSMEVRIAVDTKNVVDAGPLCLGGKEYPWMRTDSMLYAGVDVAAVDSGYVKFSTEIETRGSEGVAIAPSAARNTIVISGSASNPSFNGPELPASRSVDGSGFTAQWDCGQAGKGEYASADFLVGVDRYQKVCRAIKYAFIIIVLTFFSVFFTEVTMRYPIPMLNYFLIGVALVLFYSLLLALAEHMSFGGSYLIAAVMTIGMITCYMWRMLRSKAVGMAICAILSIMYGFCYVMLCISTYALLFGSLLLFAALAAVMYGSLRIQYR